MDSLKAECENLLGRLVTVEWVCAILQSADLHNASDLKDRCLNFVVSNSTVVVSRSSKAWLQFKTAARPELMDDLLYRLAAKKGGAPTSPPVSNKPRTPSALKVVEREASAREESSVRHFSPHRYF